MPVNAPITKVSRCRKYGAKIHLIGADIMEARQYGLKLASEEKLQYINGYDHPHILAGQGEMVRSSFDSPRGFSHPIPALRIKICNIIQNYYIYPFSWNLSAILSKKVPIFSH